MARFRHFPANPAGRDYAVGDIHGHFSRLQQALDQIGFDPQVDRLFSVGDLVDRGPQSEQSLEWLDRPWFFAVQGNHEVLTLQYLRGQPLDHEQYRRVGGGWFLDSSAEKQRLFARRFAELPIALEVETAEGLVGLVHADCPFPSWTTLREYLMGQQPQDQSVEDFCQWSRTRVKSGNDSRIDDVCAVVVGHTPLEQPAVLGNIHHIDTAGWRDGYFTLLDLAGLTRGR